ncbi:MAG: hypothetical protein RLZZ546_1822 [Bacteroidota bacterium]
MNNFLIAKRQLTQDQKENIEKFKSILKTKEEEVNILFRKIIKKSNEINVYEHLLKNDQRPLLEFWYSWDSSNMYCEALGFLFETSTWEDSLLIKEWENDIAPIWETPIELKGDYKSVKENIYSNLIREEFLIWLTAQWHKQDLSTINFNVHTVENNSVRTFDLNRGIWTDFTKIDCEVCIDPKSINKLNIISIESAVKMYQSNYEPYIALKRSFVKDSNKIYITIYDNETTLISINNKEEKSQNTIVHKDRNSAMIYYAATCLEFLDQQYEEINNMNTFQDKNIDFDVLKFYPTENKMEVPLNLPTQFYMFCQKFYKANIEGGPYEFLIEEGRAFKILNRFIYDLNFIELKGDRYLIIGNTADKYTILINNLNHVYIYKEEKLVLANESFVNFISSFRVFDYYEDSVFNLIQSKETETVIHLIETGLIDVEYRSWSGRNIINEAIIAENFEICKKLLDLGVDHHDIAINCFKNKELLKLFISYGYSPHIFTKRNHDMKQYWFYQSEFQYLFPPAIDLTQEKNDLSFTSILNKSHTMSIQEIEKKYKVSLPPDYIEFLEKFPFGASVDFAYFDININSGHPIKIEYFLSIEEIVSNYNFIQNQGYTLSPFYYKSILIPIAKCINYCYVYLKYDKTWEICIDNQYELNIYFSTTTISSSKDQAFSSFLNSLNFIDDIADDEIINIVKGNYPYFEEKFKKGWNSNYCNYKWGSPLNIAIRHNQQSIVKLLIDNGALFSIKQGSNILYSNKPFIEALIHSEIKMIDWLIELGILDYTINADLLDTASNLFKNNIHSLQNNI